MLLGDNFPGSLRFLHILEVDELTSFVLGYLSKDVCIVNNLGKMCVILGSKGQACLLSNRKDLSSLRPGFHPLMQSIGIHLGPFALPLGNWRQGKLLKKGWNSGSCYRCK